MLFLFLIKCKNKKKFISLFYYRNYLILADLNLREVHGENIGAWVPGVLEVK